jgi:hypothetical protein
VLSVRQVRVFRKGAVTVAARLRFCELKNRVERPGVLTSSTATAPPLACVASSHSGERTRDNTAASKRKGIRVGGIVPLGYEVQDRKLSIREVEAGIVRLIFERCLALGSLPALQRELRERGIVPLSSGKAGQAHVELQLQ